MSEKIYLCLFILCVIPYQGIIGVFSKDIVESNTLVRRKRVINLEPGGDVPVTSDDAPFVVNIRHFPNNSTICVGTILSRHSVITAASALVSRNERFLEIFAGSSYAYRGTRHNVIAKHMHMGNHPHSETDGIALLTVQQPFIFNRRVDTIALHTGPLLAGTSATIFGWGFNPTLPRGTNYRLQLRSITVPIMHHRECVNAYRNRHVISEKDICTYDANKRCGHTDLGAPLVVDNHLAGLYIWTGKSQVHINPDVYLILQHEEYSQWIINNIVHDI